jgi:hypothetical protein
MAIGKEETDAVGDEDTLLHGEALLVIATRDAEDIALEFLADGFSGDLLRESLVVEDATGKTRSDVGTNERSEKFAHYFLSSSISIVFCCPVAGSIKDDGQTKAKGHGEYEDILAMLSFILGQR